MVKGWPFSLGNAKSSLVTSLLVYSVLEQINSFRTVNCQRFSTKFFLTFRNFYTEVTGYRYFNDS